MSATDIRDELHQFIDRADDRMLHLIYGLMKADDANTTLTPEQQADLERRIAAHRRADAKALAGPHT